MLCATAGTAYTQWPRDSSKTASDRDAWPIVDEETSRLPSEPYVAPNAESFVCTFDHAAGMHAMNQLEIGSNGRPICPLQTNRYGSYMTGDRRAALNALIEDAGVRKDRIVATEMPGFENAAAVLCEDRQGRVKQLVIWDPEFLGRLDRNAGTKWASVAVLAHEMGHHLNNDTGQNPGVIPPHERKEQELFADRYAGQKLRQFGASREEAVAVFHHMGEGGDTHPPSSRRVAAASEGWDRGREETEPDPGAVDNPPAGTRSKHLASYCQTNFGICVRTAMTPPIPVGAICYCPSFYGLIQGIAQ